MMKTDQKLSVVDIAENFYKELSKQEGIIDTSASNDVAPGVKLKHLIDPQGWLPFIMIRSDEICQLLTGKKMWNAAYISDPMALRGISVEDPINLSDEQKGKLDLPGETSDIMPIGVKSILALEGLRSAITFKNNECYLNNLPKAYFIHGMIDEGDSLPPIPPELFFALEINKNTLKCLPILNEVMSLDSELNGVRR